MSLPWQLEMKIPDISRYSTLITSGGLCDHLTCYCCCCCCCCCGGYGYVGSLLSLRGDFSPVYFSFESERASVCVDILKQLVVWLPREALTQAADKEDSGFCLHVNTCHGGE